MSTSTSLVHVRKSTIGRSFPNPLSLVQRALGGLAVSLFCRAPRRRLRRTKPFREPDRILCFEGRRIAVHDRGSGPPVLLVHGWGGAAAQWSSLAAALLAAGHRVVSFDLPGHGRSTGASTDLGEIARVVAAVAADVGPFHATIAHSLGSPAVARAAADGAATGRLIFIAAAAVPAHYWRQFKSWLHLPVAVARAADRMLEARARHTLPDLAMSVSLAAVDAPTFFVHDERDRVAPLDVVSGLAAELGAPLLRTRGLGHARVLDDHHVVDQIADFMAGKPVQSHEHDPARTFERELEAELANPELRWYALRAREVRGAS